MKAHSNEILKLRNETVRLLKTNDLNFGLTRNLQVIENKGLNFFGLGAK